MENLYLKQQEQINKKITIDIGFLKVHSTEKEGYKLIPRIYYEAQGIDLTQEQRSKIEKLIYQIYQISQV